MLAWLLAGLLAEGRIWLLAWLLAGLLAVGRIRLWLLLLLPMPRGSAPLKWLAHWAIRGVLWDLNPVLCVSRCETRGWGSCTSHRQCNSSRCEGCVGAVRGQM